MTARESPIYFTLQEGRREHQGEDRRAPPQQVPGVRPQPRQHQGVRGCHGAADPRHQRPEHRSNSGSLVQNVIIIPDTLNLYEAMEYFKNHRGDFAVVMNEYALVVGIVTMNDLMSTVAGGVGHPRGGRADRPAGRELLAGGRGDPISDVMRAFDIEEFPENQNYETIAGSSCTCCARSPGAPTRSNMPVTSSKWWTSTVTRLTSCWSPG